VVEYKLRTTNSFNSNSFNSFDNIFEVISPNDRWMSLKRIGPLVSTKMSGNFHLPFNTYNASLIPAAPAAQVISVHFSFKPGAISTSKSICSKVRSIPKDIGIFWDTNIFKKVNVVMFVAVTNKINNNMKKILHIISSPKGENSFSIKLGNAIVDKIIAANPGSTVYTKDLTKNPFPHLEESTLAAFFTPAENHTPENKEALKNSDQAIAEIKDADIIVIGAPLWNFGVPSVLKAWIDHIARAGVTFKYDENGPEGLIKGKVVYVAMASGAIYTSGPYQVLDFVSGYLKSLLGFLGMTNLTVFRVEGSSYPGQAEPALQKGIESIVL
jgi:FMN-dependent NADH-azoreductase